MATIQEIIKGKEHKGFMFIPTPEFYLVVGINNRRWARIYRGKIEPTITEARAIAGYFEVHVTELL